MNRYQLKGPSRRTNGTLIHAAHHAAQRTTRPSRRIRLSRRIRQACLVPWVLLAGVLTPAPATANGEFLYLDCPCEIVSDGTTATVTAGVRSYRATETGPLGVEIRAILDDGLIHERLGRASITDSLEAGGRLDSDSFEIELKVSSRVDAEQVLGIVLYEQIGDRLTQRDLVRMESTVDLAGAFSVGDLDLLTDSDGDGVGDYNETAAGTDAVDADSTPPDSTLDVLVLYSQSVPGIFDGDPTARIQHEFTLANRILTDSDVQARFRVVGLLEMEMDESETVSQPDLDDRILEAERHGADIIVIYRPRPFGISICGYARGIGGVRKHGLFELSVEERNYATVFAGCGASTLAHELGHVMGLGHAFWQQDVGTWRWSRGHAVDHDFGTIMTYGPENGRYRSLDVFSDPRSRCAGLLGGSRPCGINRDEVDGADAVATLNAVRFPIAGFRASIPDTDEDGFVDPVDALPNDSGEWADTDGDGTGNNADTDDDDDGVIDADDAFPLDPAETVDSDADGVGDNGDAFPADPAETADSDADGVGDNADEFPLDPTETADADSDGVGDNADPWPEDASEWLDTDGDGTGNNGDTDDDGDGAVDDLDIYPLDASRTDLASYIFVGEQPGDQVGTVLAPGGEGERASFVIGVPQHQGGGHFYSGAVYLVAGTDLAALDTADGSTDRVINLARVASGANSWKFIGEDRRHRAGSDIASGGDLDGDGFTDLIVGAQFFKGDSGLVNEGAAYFVSGADFAAADAGDGTSDHVVELGRIAAQPRSWKFVGEASHEQLGRAVASVPDLDDDGSVEILLGAPGHDPDTDLDGAGATYLIASSDFATADAADGTVDGVIDVSHAADQPGSWKFVGENRNDRVGVTVAAPAGIAGGEGAFVAINSINHRVEGAGIGAVYLVSSADLSAADAVDGHSDSVIGLGHVAGQPDSWKLTSGVRTFWAEQPVYAVGVTDGDTAADGADDPDGAGDPGDTDEPGDPVQRLVVESFAVAVSDFPAADAADDLSDGVIALNLLAGQPDSRYVFVYHLAVVGDTDGDGREDLAGLELPQVGPAIHLLPSTILDEAEPVRESGQNWLAPEELREVWPIQSLHAAQARVELTASTAGDIDGDGLADTLIGDPGPSTAHGAGSLYLVLSADLDALDRSDGATDQDLLLANLAGDTDGDGRTNTLDRDDDGDGIPDWLDAFQIDPSEWVDTDGDGTGDNADAFPADRHERLDTDGDGLGDFRADSDDDGDGIPDSVDAYPLDTDNDGMENADDPDDDNDGVPDADDALPLDATESADTDGDGVGNNADTDDDNDGVADNDDALPLDARDSVDTDGDGVGDNTDAFPGDAAETADFDGDGIGDNADTDDDNDGVADSDDLYPFDASISMDTDGDGVPDSLDRYPTNPREWANTDGAGFGDNRDTDDDNDGVPDTEDLFPTDRTRSDLTSVRFRLTPAYDGFVPGVAGLGDLDGVRGDEFLFRAPEADEDTAAYIVSGGDLTAADDADGVSDGSIEVQHVPARNASWKLQGVEDDYTGIPATALGDLEGDGKGEFLESRRGFESTGDIVSGADLLAADALDEIADSVIGLGRVWSQPNSWRLRGLFRGGTVRTAFPADFDGDGAQDLAVGQPGIGSGESPGNVLLFRVDNLSALDARNGVDGFIQLASERVAWNVTGESPRDAAGNGLAMADFDQDGTADLVVGAPLYNAVHQDEGAVYLLSSQDRDAADLADGAEDARIELEHVTAQANSWKFVGDTLYGYLGETIHVGELTGDGRPDLVLVSQASPGQQPVVSVVSGDPADLAILDAADGTGDRTVTLDSSGTGASATLTGFDDVPTLQRLDLADYDGDGRDDLVIGFRRDHVNSKAAHLVTASSLLGSYGTSADDTAGLDPVLRDGGSYEIYAPEATTTDLWIEVGSAGDVDADGKDDVLLAVVPYIWGDQEGTPHSGSVYLLMGVDLPLLDSADGRSDGRIFLSNLVRERQR